MQRKKVKRFILALIIIWLSVVIAGLLFSRSLQDKIVGIVTEQIEKNLLTEVHLRKSNIHFSVFKKFPLASIELRNVVVKVPPKVVMGGIRPPYADTLLYAKKLYLQLNLKSLIEKEYRLKKISINDGYIQVLKDRYGNSSLSILKPTDKENDFRTNIVSLSLSNMKIYSNLEESRFRSVLVIKKSEASGIFSESDFNVNLKTNGFINEIDLPKKRLKPMQRFRLSVVLNKKDNVYSIKKGNYQISNIPMRVVGKITVGKNNLFDLVFSATNVSLKNIDKTLLDEIAGNRDFEPQSGNLNIQSSVKGYFKQSTPSIKASFTLNNGKVFDRKREITYSKIYCNGYINNGNIKHHYRKYSVHIDTFYVQTPGSTQHGELNIRNLNNPEITAKMYGIIDATEIKTFLHLQDVKLNHGKIQNAIQLTGSLNKSPVKPNFSLTGTFIVSDLNLNLEKYQIPELTVNGILKVRSKHALYFESMHCQAENSSIEITGLLNHFQSKPNIPVFTGKIYSSDFYVDDFVTKNGKKSRSVNFPDSVIVNANLTIDNLYFGKFSPQDISGNVKYNDKTLAISEFKMNSFSGTVHGNVKINQSKTDITLSSSAVLKRNNLEEIFHEFNNFGQDVISSEHINGNVSGTIKYSSTWNNGLKIYKPSILTHGDLLIENGELKDYEPLLGLSKFIEVEELKHIEFDNLSTQISIRNKKVILDQTHIASSAITFDGSGIHDFDNKYEYRLQVGLSELLWKKARKKKSDISEFGYVVNDDSKRTVIPFIIFGKGSNFDVKIDKRTSRKNFREKMQEERKELKELFRNEELEQQNEEKVTDATDNEVEEKKEDSEVKLKKTDSGTYQHKTDEFILEWDEE